MKVYLSPLALKKLESLLSYLESEWSTYSKEEFLSKFSRSIESVNKLPEAYPKSPSHPSIYKCVVTSQTSFYYRLMGEEIEIITIIDNRQQPDSIINNIDDAQKSK